MLDESTLVSLGDARVMFPCTREALDQAAVCASINGIFIVDESVPKHDVLRRAQTGLDALPAWLMQMCKAFVFPSIFGIEVEIFADDELDLLMRRSVHDTITLWLDPGEITFQAARRGDVKANNSP